MDAHPTQQSRSTVLWASIALVGILAFVAVVLALDPQPKTPAVSPYQAIIDDVRASGVAVPGPGGDQYAVMQAANAICQHQGTRQYLVTEGIRHRFTYRQINTLIDSSVRNLCPDKQFLR